MVNLLSDATRLDNRSDRVSVEHAATCSTPDVDATARSNQQVAVQSLKRPGNATYRQIKVAGDKHRRIAPGFSDGPQTGPRREGKQTKHRLDHRQQQITHSQTTFPAMKSFIDPIR